MNKPLCLSLLLIGFVACISIRGQDTHSKTTNTDELGVIDNAIQQLHIAILKEPIDLDVALYKVSPNNPKETILVIPETVSEDDDIYELNTHIFSLDNKTGQVTANYFESSKTNGWISDAIFIDEITIDTTGYKITPSIAAFGVIIKWRNSSQPNPYRQESISLYAKEKDSINKVLDLYTIYESSGEVNVNACYAKFNKIVNKLSVSNSKTEDYFDILIDEIMYEEVFKEDKNGECNPKEKIISIEKKVLKFRNEAYSKKKFSPKNLELNKAIIDSVSLKEIKLFSDAELPTIYEYYKKEKVDEVAIWSNKMFGRCCSEADLDYSELLEFEINATTTNTKYPSSNLSDKTYRTTYVFREDQNAEIRLKLRSVEEHEYHTNRLLDEIVKPNDTLLKPFKLSLVNGYVKSQRTFEENGRIKELKVLLNNSYQGTIELLDTPTIQQFEIDFTFSKNDEVTLIPLSFYSGTTYQDICISEIQSSLSQITHPSVNKKYKITDLQRLGNAIKKPEK